MQGRAMSPCPKPGTVSLPTPDWPAVAARKTCRAHLVGAAGSGMRSLAQVLHGLGWLLSGSDASSVEPDLLVGAGLRIRRGHAAENVSSDTDLVIASDAVPADSPELCRARELGIPVQSYFQTVGQLMARRNGLAVSGTHGKSSVTAMAARLLVDAEMDPTVICGAVPIGCRSGGRAGDGPHMLAEACEYRANFLHLKPRQAVVLAVEPDHFDCYRSRDELEQAFARFAGSLPPDGLLLVQHDCPAARRATSHAGCRIETFGNDPRADWSARRAVRRGGRYAFSLFRHESMLCRVRLAVAGRHSLLNATAAAALAWHQGVKPSIIAAGLSRFAGLRRRLEHLPACSGVLRVDDYAHHPTEVSASLESIRQVYPGRQIWCVFQPHQVSRTEHLLDELALSLQNADKVLVAEIFRAREPGPRPGEVTAADLAERARALGADASYLPGRRRILRVLRTHLRPGDVMITMGAGDIGRIQDDFVLAERLREDRQAG